MAKAQDIIQKTGCSGCGSTHPGPHACPGGLQYEFDIVLMSIPFEKKWTVIKVIREIVGFKMTLEEAQKLVEPISQFVSAHPQRAATPGVTFQKAISKKEACDIALRLEAAGAVVELC